MQNTIASLAILKVNWDHAQKDYLENFLPFVATLVKSKAYRQVDASQFRDDFQTDYGLRVPYHAMVSILNRARKRGLLRLHGHRLLPVANRLNELDFSESYRVKSELLKGVIDRLVKYSLEQHGITVAAEDAYGFLVQFLRDHEMDLLFAASDDSALPATTSTRQGEYLLCSFARHIHEAEPMMFKELVDVAIGHTLANTLLYGKDNPFGASLTGACLFLDTPFLVRLLKLV